MAPGSKVVTEYLRESGLLGDLEALGFQIVGYGCTTCIGNSGPLPQAIAKAVAEEKLVAAAVLSGNRNFEGRINPPTRANYLASPPLVVAYAPGRHGRHRSRERAARHGQATGSRSILRDVWPTPEGDRRRDRRLAQARDVRRPATATCSTATRSGTRSRSAAASSTRGTTQSTYIHEPPFFQG